MLTKNKFMEKIKFIKHCDECGDYEKVQHSYYCLKISGVREIKDFPNIPQFCILFNKVDYFNEQK
jgi:hypothetical protein